MPAAGRSPPGGADLAIEGGVYGILERASIRLL